MDFERDWNFSAADDRQQALGQDVAAALRAGASDLQPGKMPHIVPGPDGTVVLPAGTDLNRIQVAGSDLVVTLPDGTQMVIDGGAVFVPRMIVGDVEIPAANLAALLIGEEPQPAAGPPQSSGGNFVDPQGDIGDRHGLGDLLPPTELAFGQPEQQEIIPVAPDDDDQPEITIVTPDQPAGASNATAQVSEAGLGPREGEPAGSAAQSDSEKTSGSIVIAALDQPATVTINGIVVTGIGQMIETDLGVLTIRSIGNGEIGYSYTLTDNIIGPPPSEIFTIIVTDADGDQATATLTISIADDAPTAIGDVDSVTEDGPLIADGNVLTGTGGADANGTDGVADVQGADGAVVSTTGTFQGSYGVLTLQADGSYVYVLANGNAAVQNLVPGQTLTESFNYSITDGDGDISTATLTITINGAGDAVTITGLDRDPAANGAEAVVLENDLADGSSPDAAALTQGGAFAIAAPDGLSTVTVGGVTVLSNGSFVAGQVITTPQGVLTITGFTPAAQAGTSVTAGTFTYSFALTGNSLDHGAAGTDSLFQSFDVVATDRDGSNASATLDIRIVDDVPVAHDDVDRVAAGSYEPEGGNVITGAGTVSGAAGADVKGADGASVAGVAAGAGGAAQVAAGTVGTAIAGTYGTLILDADGGYSYVRATGTPGGVSDSFTYTLRDGDGDLSAATLRIDIADSPVVIISIPRAGDGASVEEAGLDHPAGSKAASDAETTTGTITYSAPDGPAIISVNGTSITGVGQTIVTDKGVLTITGLTDGGIDYSYTLTTSTTGNDVTDSFQLTITDTDDNSATDSLVITIVDDVSTATPDIDSVREDGPLTADGNVMTGSGGTDANATDGNKDVAGADGAQVTGISFGGATGAVGAPVAGSYGVLQIEADGSYRYVLNNGNGAVQGLDSTQTLKEIFTYTITDGDGDPSAATLTITIHGRDDGVTITGLGGQGAEEVVYESDLADGSSPDAAALVQTGSFTLEALDGVSTITVDGKSVFSGGGFTGATITNAYGTLQITGFTPVTGADGDVIGGELFYKYTLNDNSLLHKGANDGSLTDSFLVVVTDTDSSVANASLDIRVVDDVPMAHDDVAIQTSENTPILIDVFANDVAGADGVDLSSGVVLESGAAKGTVVYQGNGVFLYTAAPGAEGEDSFTYKIIDGDGDPSIATVTITLAGDSKPSVQVSDLTVWEAGLPNGTQASGNLETDSGVMTIATGGDALAKVEVQGKDGWVEVTAATAGSPIIVSGLAGQLTVTSDGAGHYSYSYTLTANDPNHPDHDPTDGDGISGAADPRAGDSFAVRVTDSDGDVSPADSIHVTVLDDAPTLTVGGATSVVEGATATGTWSEVIGADQPGASTVVLVGANSYAIGTPINTGVGTLTVKADGTWSFAASNNLNNNANPSLSFTVKVTDADGDVAQDTQTIGITDGAGPMAGAALDLALDDQNLADGTTSGNPDFASGLASFTAGSDALTGFAFAAGTGALGGGLTWNRVSGTLIEGWDGPVNTGTKIVSLALSAPASIAAGVSGTVTVTATLLDNYDSHPGINLDDLVALGNIGVVASDQDGDSATVTVNLTVSDDVPTLTVGGATSVVEGATATGTWSEVIGADQPGASTVVLVGANSYAIGTPINTGVGTLTVKADGTWSFAASNNLNNNANPSLSFTVKVTDADGDVAQDTQTIGITDGAGPMAGAALDLALDDQNLADGTTPGNPDFASGLASFTAGSDALTGFAFAAGTGALGGGLTWNRVSGTLIEGWDGPVNTGTKIVSLTLSAPASIAAGAVGTVTVTATLLDNYDSHPGVNLDDLVALGNIGVVASDQDGDSATVTVNLTVSDDVPTAVDDGQIASVDDNASGIVIGTLSGLLANDSFGADGQGSPSITIATGSLGGTVTINGGNLVYASHHDITAPYASVVETFTYTIKDGDGDTATATFTVQLTDSGPTLSQAAASFTVDEDGLNGGITAPAPGDVPGADVVRTGTLAGLNFGGDGPGDIVLAAMADTGLRTLSGHVVETVWNPATHMLTGQDATNGTPVFTLQITNVVTGAYQFELLAPIKHSNPASEDDKSLSIGVTVRDAEGESAHGAISITINDDSPALTVGSAAAGALAVDETSLSTDGTASFAGLFTPQYGADGVGSVGNYVLGVSASGAASGVFDTATGHQVFLFQEGGKVVGRAGANAGTAAGGPVVFQLSVDAAGVVTLDQQRAVLHSPDSGPNQPLSITTASLITLTATVTDGDGDTVSATAHIATAITFFDDVGNLGSFSNISVINGANVVGHGTFAYDPGADGHGSFAITAPPLAGITYSTVQNATGALLTATTDPDGAGGNPPVTVFTLQVNADGTSVFTLVEPQVGTMETLSLLGLKAGGPTNFVESSDGSVEFTGIGGGINSSNNGFGVGNPFVRYDQGFTVEFHTPGQSGDEAPGANPEMVSSLVLKNEKVNGSLQIKVTVYNDVTGQSEVVHTNLSITESSLTVIDPIMAEFNRVVIEGVGGSGQGVRFTSIDIHKSILPADLDLSFQIQATDRDGDPTSTSTLNVFVDAASPAPPIAIDLDGDGLEFVGLAAGVTHDYGHGQVATAWVAADDGLLAHATGSVHDINFADDAAGASSDLEGLRLAYDGNGDGVFDAKDAAFGEFGIWQDANSNGKVDAGEYVSLTDAGIQSIQLVSDGRSYGAANGDVKVLGEAVFTTVDGRTGTIGDAIFASGGRESDSGKVAAASTSTTGFNQALVAASLVAAANLQPESGDVAAAAGQADDPNAGTSDQPVLTQSMFAPLESIASDQPSNALADGVQDKTEASPTAARSSHGAGEETVHHAGLGADLEAGTAAPDVADGADQASPALHQALLAQPIDLAGFDGAAAMLPADHAPAPAHAAMVAQVVSEALGHADAPNIDALLAALPNGPHTAPVFGGGAAELLDGGHMAAIAGGAGGAFDAAMVMHEAMALAHA